MAEKLIEISNSDQSPIKSEEELEIEHGKVEKSKLGMSANIAISLSENRRHSEASQLMLMKKKKQKLHRKVSSQSLLDEGEYSMKSSPKQVFPHIDCLNLPDNIILCYILSVWDNIVGPQTVYVWKQSQAHPHSFLRRDSQVVRSNKATGLKTAKKALKSNAEPSKNLCSDDTSKGHSTSSQSSSVENLSHQSLLASSNTSIGNKDPKTLRHRLRLSEVVKFVTDHSVGAGEIGSLIDNRLVTHYISIPHKRIAVFSVRFHLMEGDKISVPYCMSGVLHIEDELKFLPYLPMSLDSLQKTALKMRLSIAKDGLEAGVAVTPDLVELTETLSSLVKANLCAYPSYGLPDAPTDRHLAELMLTSHLQTGGYTLVAADSPNTANKVVLWLSMFSAEDKSASRFAFSEAEWPYQSGPKIQAVIRDATGGFDVSSTKLLCSGHPLTLIDLHHGTVRQLAQSGQQKKMYLDALKTELTYIWCSPYSLGATSHCLFDHVKVVSPLVKKLLQECGYLSSCKLDVRKKYLKYFKRSMYYSALAVVLWIRETGSSVSQRKDKGGLRQELLSTFKLVHADLKVLLALAEEFEPGVMSFVYA